MSNNPEDYVFTGANITASPIDMSSFLEEGEIDVTHVNLDEISETLTYKELLSICKITKSFIWPFGPVGLMRTGFTRKSRIAFEAGAQRCGTMDDIINFLKERKGILVYQCIKYKLPNERYIIRFFSNRDCKYIKLNVITYLWNRMTDWKTGFKKIKEIKNENMC